MITVEMLLQAPALKGLKVVAGENGLQRQIRVVSVMDAPDSYKWLKGGEFIMTTGYLGGGNEHFLELDLLNLVKADSSALGIKKGRHLRKIPENLIALANQQQFPLIEIPYAFGWSEIIAVFYELLYSIADGWSKTLILPDSPTIAPPLPRQVLLYEKLLLALTSGTLSPDKIRYFAKLRRCNATTYTGVLLIRAHDTINVYQRLVEMLSRSYIIKIGKANSFYYECTAEDDAVVILELQAKDDDSSHEWLRMLFEEMEYCLLDSPDSFIAASRLSPRLDDIVSCYQEAREAYAIGRALWHDRHCFLYSLLSVYCVLQNANPQDIDCHCIDFLDKQQDGLSFDGIISLETYIETGSFRKAAAKLFIHENSLRYRIHRIAELLHLDLNDPVIAHSLITQIKLWRLRQMREGEEGIENLL
jgi:purine catabolism regulator